MNKFFLHFLFTIFLALASQGAQANPLFDGADPDTLVEDNQVWIYPTTEGIGKKDFYTYRSQDFTHWQRLGPILEKKNISWINNDGAPLHELWAPGIFKNGKHYYLFYAVGPQNPTPSRIGVAVSDTPDGVFVDRGKPLVTGSAKFEAIDPMVFKDQRSGKIFLYCGGSAGPEMHIYELGSDCTSIKRSIKASTPKNFTEAPFMHLRHKTYYLSYSHGHWNDDSYSVCYATAKTPVGPWTERGVILKSDEFHAGPGHHSFAHDQKSGQWYIIYHRWNNAKTSGKMQAGRSVAIDQVQYDDAGLIAPIEMTN